jgi:phosphoglycolate phosphatase
VLGRPPAADWPRAVLFDLDGTLIDSAPDLAAAINTVLAAAGLAPYGLDEVRIMIGGGVRMLVQHAFAGRTAALDPPGLDAQTAAMRAVYTRRLTVLTTLMPGARAAVAEQRRLGRRLGIATNKPIASVLAILDHFALRDAMAVVVGEGRLARKPAPDMLLHALREMGMAAADAVMVGDSAADIGAARAAGMAAVAVRGGYGGVPADGLAADAVADGLADLARTLDGLRVARPASAHR